MSFHHLVINVAGRDGRTFGFFELPSDATLTQLKVAFFEKNRKYRPERQWFTLNEEHSSVLKTAALKDDALQLATLADGNGTLSLVFKDLGAQVFLVEYLGPLLIHPLLFFFPAWFYPDVAAPKHAVQWLALGCVLFHYAKREFETVFVHRFSNATMPWFNLVKNSFHYWILSGVAIAYFVYHPLYTPAAWLVDAPFVQFLLVALFLFCELNNLHCHLILRSLRAPGSKERGIPTGNLFSLVSCANYTWELAAWLTFAIMTQTLTCYIFFLVSFGQIYLWALKKHAAYRSDFATYPRRKALVPFVV